MRLGTPGGRVVGLLLVLAVAPADAASSTAV